MNDISMAWRLARRELRGGLRGFWVFLVCLALGVGTIAAIGTVRTGIQAGLAEKGAEILGGDAEMRFTYRRADDAELAWMNDAAIAVSEVFDFRSMVVVGTGETAERGLTQIKAIDDIYPIYGKIEIEPAVPLAQALAPIDGVPGAIIDGVLIDRLGLSIGDNFHFGTQEFRLSARLITEPDGGSSGFSLGPRTIVATASLANSGLLQEGTLFETRYRMKLPEGADLAGLENAATNAFRDQGMRWTDARNGAPGISTFVERIAAFLVLVGLAGLAVGGVGVSAAVRAYLDRKTSVIATLKTLGAQGRVIFMTYLMQIGVLAVVGVAGGVALGAVGPVVFGPILEASLPFPALISLRWEPLGEAAVYGMITAFLFTLWPLARTENIRAAALFRDGTSPAAGRPRAVYIAATMALAVLLIAVAAWFSGVAVLAFWSAVGVITALIILALAAALVRRLVRFMATRRMLRGRPALRWAMGAVGAPGGEATSVVLSLGLGLSVLAAIGQIDSNLRAAIAQDLPDVAPSYFFVDIQPDQIDGFTDRVTNDTGVSRTQSAPMLRGIITRINGKPARDVVGDHWVINGDRGVTYSVDPPSNARITQGSWWEADYTGPPIVSFAEEEALEMGLTLGDEITVNILGRDLTATITSLRAVDFSDASMNFIMSFNPSSLAGAPHSYISTVYATEETEAPLLRDLAQKYPNITAVRVRDAIARVSEALNGIASATSFGAAATLLTGFVVLIGAAAAGERARVFEAAVLKTLGAGRGRILTSFALRAAMLGAAAGAVAIFAGGLAGYLVMTLVMESSFAFDLVSAMAIVLGGALTTLLAGLLFAWRPLSSRPAQILRAND